MQQFRQWCNRKVFGVIGLLLVGVCASIWLPRGKSGLALPFTKYVSAQIAADLVLEAAHSPFDSAGLRTQIFRLLPDNSAALAEQHLANAQQELAQDNLANAQRQAEQALALAELWLRENHEAENEAAQALWMQRTYQFYLNILLRRHHRDPQGGFAVMAWQASDRLHWLLTTINRAGEVAAKTQARELRVADVQRQLLDEQSLLLEYALSDERSYVWAIGKEQFDCFELPARAAIEEKAIRLTALLSTQPENVVTDPTAEYDRLTQELSELVLQPLQPVLAGKRLIIVADGALQHVPFSILPAPKEDMSAARGQRSIAPTSLLSEHEIQSLPSAMAGLWLQQQHQDKKPEVPATAKTVALIADPVFGKYDERVPVTAEASPPAAPAESMLDNVLTRLRHLKLTATGARPAPEATQILGVRLPAARREAETIAAVVPQSAKLLDFDASRAVALSGALAKYPVLHFATHGFLHPEDPALSGLLLSQVNEHGQTVNGMLLNREISRLHLPAELVVLSACETGVSAENRNHHSTSIAHSFIQAGAQRVVASLWQVNDEATAELMRRFYRHMFGPQHLRPGLALRAAQLEMQRDTNWKRPFYWAAFVLLGEG